MGNALLSGVMARSHRTITINYNYNYENIVPGQFQWPGSHFNYNYNDNIVSVNRVSLESHAFVTSKLDMGNALHPSTAQSIAESSELRSVFGHQDQGG